MGELRFANAEEFFEGVTVESLEHAVDVLKRWPIKKRYRDFAKFQDDAKDLAEWLFSRSERIRPEGEAPNELPKPPVETRPERTVKLVAYRFSCVEDNAGLYNRYVGGFLRWNRGSAVWIEGASAKGEAYLVVKDHLKERAARTLKNELSRGGTFAFRPVNPLFVIHQAKELNRETRGYLRHGRIEVGDYDEIFCPLENLRRVSVRESCIGTEELQKPCPHWDRWRCIYPKKGAFAQAPKETTWCPDRREEVPATYCLQCEKSDLAKWQACREFKEEEAAGVGL